MPSPNNWSSVTYGEGTFVAVAGDTNMGAYSYDGSNWDSCTLSSTNNWSSVAYGIPAGAGSTSGSSEEGEYVVGSFVAVATGPTANGVYSASGQSTPATASSMPFSANWSGVAAACQYQGTGSD
jgi:hypothetical protein